MLENMEKSCLCQAFAFKWKKKLNKNTKNARIQLQLFYYLTDFRALHNSAAVVQWGGIRSWSVYRSVLAPAARMGFTQAELLKARLRETLAAISIYLSCLR